MRRLFLILGLALILIMPQAWGATTSPYPNPNRQTMWNNITDAAHTFGQNAQQTQTTLRKLHRARTKTRLKSISQANAAKIRARRQAWLNSGNNL
jgi:predicted lipoprotein